MIIMMSKTQLKNFPIDKKIYIHTTLQNIQFNSCAYVIMPLKPWTTK